MALADHTRIDTVVIGAGQAGLAASHCLSERGVEHVVLEAAGVAHRWRSDRWDSLRLLTPNWMNQLPGWSTNGHDPDGFMTSSELVSHLDGYARRTAAPVLVGRTVESLALRGNRFDVVTAMDRWLADSVIIATGWCDRPHVPSAARDLSSAIAQLTPSTYRNPTSVPDGGVLVVGASASGVQLAHELATAGRRVLIAVGNHSRLPRRYRGLDIYWWLDRIGSLDQVITELPDPIVAVREPSLQLVGHPDGVDVDLAALQRLGVELLGRVEGARGTAVHVAADLESTTAIADSRMRRVLRRIDTYISANGLDREVLGPNHLAPVTVRATPSRVDLAANGVTSVLWATGYRRQYPWLEVPVLDGCGEIIQRRGVTPVRGLYVLGQRFQHRRSSSFIGGVGRDARFVADHIALRRLPTHILEGAAP